MKILLLILIVWFVFLTDLTINVNYKNVKYKIVWNGLLWVVLDYYTIQKYHSNDKPMKLVIFTKEIE